MGAAAVCAAGAADQSDGGDGARWGGGTHRNARATRYRGGAQGRVARGRSRLQPRPAWRGAHGRPARRSGGGGLALALPLPSAASCNRLRGCDVVGARSPCVRRAGRLRRRRVRRAGGQQRGGWPPDAPVEGAWGEGRGGAGQRRVAGAVRGLGHTVAGHGACGKGAEKGGVGRGRRSVPPPQRRTLQRRGVVGPGRAPAVRLWAARAR